MKVRSRLKGLGLGRYPPCLHITLTQPISNAGTGGPTLGNRHRPFSFDLEIFQCRASSPSNIAIHCLLPVRRSQHGHPDLCGRRVAAQVPAPASQLESDSSPGIIYVSDNLPRPPAEAMAAARIRRILPLSTVFAASPRGEEGQSDPQEGRVPHDGAEAARPPL